MIHATDGAGEIRIETFSHPSDVLGTIVNISQGAIHIKLSHFLNAKSVRVWFSEDCHSDGQVVFCRAENKAYRAGIHFPPDPSHHKRSELRIPLTNQPAIVSPLEGRTKAKHDAQALDISRAGLGLLMDQHLTVDTWVKVELGFAIAFGEVKYSRPDGAGSYRIGLQVETLLMRQGTDAHHFEMENHPGLSELESKITAPA